MRKENAEKNLHRKWKTFLSSLSPSFFPSHHHHIIDKMFASRRYTKRDFHSTESSSHILSLSSAHEENALLTPTLVCSFFSVCACFIVDKREENSFFFSSRKKEKARKGHKNILRQRRDVQMSYNSGIIVIVVKASGKSLRWYFNVVSCFFSAQDWRLFANFHTHCQYHTC